MQKSCETILSMAPPLEKSELFAPLEQRQEAWAPYFQHAAAAGPVELLEKCPTSGRWWNSYRSPVNVRSDSSSSGPNPIQFSSTDAAMPAAHELHPALGTQSWKPPPDDESTSEKEEEGGAQLEGCRVTKPRASLLGKCDFGDTNAEPCKDPGSQLQSCRGSLRDQFHHANENNRDLFGNSQQITDAGESQNACSKCGKNFARKSSLKKHARVHKSKKPYQCSICSKRFLEKWNFSKHLRRHMKSSHSEGKSYKCPECGERFITSASYAKHRRMHASEITYQCPECERSYVAEKHLVRHLMKAHSGANLYKCSACDKGFLEETDLVRHQTVTHKRGSRYRCPDCGKGYKEKSSLVKHQRAHKREYKMNFRAHQSLVSPWGTQETEKLHKSLNYERHFLKNPPHVMLQESNMEEMTHMCPDCGKCFKDERCFADHQVIHTKEQQRRCPSEGGVFKEGAMVAPNQIVQEELNCNQWCDGGQSLSTGSALAMQPKTTVDENLHICPDCGKVFKGNQYFDSHLRSHTQEKQSKNASQGETFKERMLPAGQQETHSKQSLHRCPTCEKVYSTEYNLRRHQQEHRECRPSESANWKKDLACRKSLTEKDHTEGQPQQHKCSYCGKEFRAKNLLNKHLKTHTEGKPYQCTDCGKTLAYEHIFSHYREVHAEGQVCPYKCAHCGKAFRTPSSLRRHQQLHTEGKPYRCSTCGKGFAFRDALAHHQEIHILMQERSHICLFCGKTFATNDSLNRHKRIHMETRSYQCSICGKAFGTKYSLRRHLAIHAKRSLGHSPSGGKDLGGSSALAKNQSSDTEENSNNWSDSSTLSGHQEVHQEGKKLECCRSMNDSALKEPKSAHLEEYSAKRLGFKRTFRDGSEIPKDLASHKSGHFKNLFDNSFSSGHQDIHVEENPHKCAGSGVSSTLPQCQSAHSEENSTEWLDGDKTVKAGSILIQGQLNHTKGNVNELTQSSVYSGHQGAHVEDKSPECSENGGTFLASSTPIKYQSTHREENSGRGKNGEKLIKDKSPNSSHQKIINKKHHICSECGKAFKDRYALKRHSYTHSVVRPYHCQKCEKSFVAPRDLARHQTSHTDLKPYPCTECGKYFKRKSSVYKHQMTSHRGEKYCCSYCGKRITTSSGLSRHLRTHTGERPYKCPECDTSFASCSSLKKHLHTHLKRNSVEVPNVDELNQTS